ncbi:hypothetical protein MLD38_029891 [Melastoma candidum]|uniref:Uncharacterized protein n=1 Tax=Melastoma candidum TaxID=119954 RepID=A0ACB9N554_9MYRT|nr:hypothetical protein MLD38_029891 [Melastoma candidum]
MTMDSLLPASGRSGRRAGPPLKVVSSEPDRRWGRASRRRGGRVDGMRSSGDVREVGETFAAWPHVVGPALKPGEDGAGVAGATPGEGGFGDWLSPFAVGYKAKSGDENLLGQRQIAAMSWEEHQFCCLECGESGRRRLPLVQGLMDEGRSSISKERLILERVGASRQRRSSKASNGYVLGSKMQTGVTECGCEVEVGDVGLDKLVSDLLVYAPCLVSWSKSVWMLLGGQRDFVEVMGLSWSGSAASLGRLELRRDMGLALGSGQPPWGVQDEVVGEDRAGDGMDLELSVGEVRRIVLRISRDCRVDAGFVAAMEIPMETGDRHRERRLKTGDDWSWHCRWIATAKRHQGPKKETVAAMIQELKLIQARHYIRFARYEF